MADNKSTIHGVDFSSLLDPSAIINWIFGAELTADLGGVDYKWAVIQCTDAFAWALSDDGRWKIGVEGSNHNAPRDETLTEIRIFCKTHEILIWRTMNGFAGRIASEQGASGIFSPVFASSAFRGDVDATAKVPRGFQLLRTGGGLRTVVPVGSLVRTGQHVQEDLYSGVLRIALVRFLEVT